MRSLLAWVMAVTTVWPCWCGQPAERRATPNSHHNSALKPGVHITFVATGADAGPLQTKGNDGPSRCLTLRITNNTRWKIMSVGFRGVWGYSLVADNPGRQAIPCRTGGDVIGEVDLAARQSALICVPPEHLRPGYAISISYSTDPQNAFHEVYFGNSDLPATIRDTKAHAKLNPCVASFVIPEPPLIDPSYPPPELNIPALVALPVEHLPPPPRGRR